MPECHVDVRWPDGREESIYSPSLVMEELLTVGASYPVTEFVTIARSGLQEASRRVEARFGHPCSLAAASLAAVERAASPLDQAAAVEVLAIRK